MKIISLVLLSLTFYFANVYAQSQVSAKKRLDKILEATNPLIGLQEGGIENSTNNINDNNGNPVTNDFDQSMTGKKCVESSTIGFEMGYVTFTKEQLNSTPEPAKSIGVTLKQNDHEKLIEMVKIEAKKNRLITFSWHPLNPKNMECGFDDECLRGKVLFTDLIPIINKPPLERIEFKRQLDEIINFTNKLKDETGPIPIIFRPFHEGNLPCF